jgi:DNA-binding transcriptional MerR regulator
MADTLTEFMIKRKWPEGFRKAVSDSKNHVAFRFIVVDNSKSMLKRDGHNLSNIDGIKSYQVCSRWEEVSESVRIIASLADAAGTPTQVRLLNKANSITVGVDMDNGFNLSMINKQLEVEPTGLTPICKQIKGVIKKLENMEETLNSLNKIALLIIMTDGESSDGSIVDVLKPLEGLPLQIIIHISTDDRAVTEYWHQVNAQLDLDIYVLDDLEAEAATVGKSNSWLTYGEPLHRLRQFGVMIPAIDILGYRQLSKADITQVAQILLFNSECTEKNWTELLSDIEKDTKLTYCSVDKKDQSWINLKELEAYEPDPIRLAIENNEELLWKIFIFYAFNSALLSELITEKHAQYTSMEEKLKNEQINEKINDRINQIKKVPVFKSIAKYEKKLLDGDDLWQLLNDFDLVPSIIK